MIRFLACLAGLGVCALAQTTPQWTLFEDTRVAERDYDNPLHDVEVLVEFSAPSGRSISVPAFWDGDRNWRVRFSPDEVGAWKLLWRSEDSSNGLDGRSDAFECVPYEGDNPLLRHGPVDVAPEGRHFAHADGKPFFWLGDTAWNGVLLATEQDWNAFLDHRAAQGFSVMQFVALPWRSAAGNQHGRPAYYGDEDVAIDPNFFQRMDERVAAINAQGLLAAPVLFWTHERHVDLNPGMHLPERDLIALGRYMIARYGAYQTTWILAGDGDYKGERAERWRRVGRALFGPGASGIERPVTVHATYWNADAFESEDWWDYNGYQSGHNRIRGLERVTQGEPTEFWRNDSRPVLNLEPNYEAHRNRAPNADPDDVFDALDVRRQAWYSLLNAPPAGLTYGVHGIWAWHLRTEEPMTHPGTGLGQAWLEAMRLEGSDNLAVLAKIFRDLDWTTIRPAQDLLQAQPGVDDVTRWVSVGRGDGFVLAYSGSGDAIEFSPGVHAGADAEWISPRSGERWNAKADGRTYQPPSSTVDWVLLLRPR